MTKLQPNSSDVFNVSVFGRCNSPEVFLNSLVQDRSNFIANALELL